MTIKANPLTENGIGMEARTPTRDESVQVTCTYSVTLRGHDRTFTAATVVTGSPAAAARHLGSAVVRDASNWVQTQRAATSSTTAAIPNRGPFGGRRLTADPDTKLERGAVMATVGIGGIGGISHEYNGEFSTAGDPRWAALAALYTAQDDLCAWALAQKNRRS